MAAKVARSLISPNVIDYIPVSEDYNISEIAPPASFLGKSIAQLNLRNKYHIEVIAIRDVLSDRITLIPPASSVIKDSDILVVIGKDPDIQKIK